MSVEQKQYILSELSQKYDLSEVVFTLEKPVDTSSYSTVFVGQTGDFDEYGTFAGLAETIDKGNQIKNDNAFVFADHTADLERVISVIDHEVGHIVDGKEHEYTVNSLYDFADSYHAEGPILSVGVISCPTTITGCVSGAVQDTYHNTSYVTFEVPTSGYYNIMVTTRHVSGGTAPVNVRVSGPPDIWDPISVGSTNRFYLTAGNLYSVYNKEGDARKIVEFISRRDAILSILSEIPDPVSVVFGDDSGIEALKPSSMVVAKFGSNDNEVGRIGVIGPTRMAYEDLIPSISYFAKQLGKVLEQSIRDLDD